MAPGLLLVTAQLSRAIYVFCGNQMRLWAVLREMGGGKIILDGWICSHDKKKGVFSPVLAGTS